MKEIFPLCKESPKGLGEQSKVKPKAKKRGGGGPVVLKAERKELKQNKRERGKQQEKSMKGRPLGKKRNRWRSSRKNREHNI